MSSAAPTQSSLFCRWRGIRHAREDGLALFHIGAAVVAGACFESFLRNKGNCNGLSRAFGIRDQDGRRRRIQDLHVDARYGHPRLHGRRDPRARRGVCGDDQRADRRADRRRRAVPGRLLHAVSARLRPAHRRVRAVPAGADRQAPGRDARRRAAQLGPRVRRQFRRRLHGGGDDGDRLHLRLLARRRTRSAR